MNDTDTKKIEPNIELFDLEGVSAEEREEFAEDINEVIMQKILRKAWAELDSSKRNVLIDLLEKSEEDPESTKKTEEVFVFLEAHVPNLSEFVARELEAIQTTYRESRDQLRDAQV